MSRTQVRQVQMHSADRLWVGAHAWSDGAVTIEGQDLGPNTPGGEEFEYYFTVEPADVPLLVAALGGTGDDDPLALLAAHGEEIVTHGEMRWLREHEVPFSLQTW
jgi:hypothetical protein